MDHAPAQAERSKQRERAERILDVAAELLLKWGYKRVTIDDIAERAGVGTGTVYLHWKTRQSLFQTLLMRETVYVWNALLEQMRADPEEVLLHRMMHSLLLIVMRRPLARALFTGNKELLGKLSFAGVDAELQKQQMAAASQYLSLLRAGGLMRTDVDFEAQMYAFSATLIGFCFIDPLLGPFLVSEKRRGRVDSPGLQETGEMETGDHGGLSLETKAAMLARTIRLAFEPEELPSLASLQELAAKVIAIIEQICEAYMQQIQKNMLH
ncbi:TetR/AcrR family transcriptional regulator [Ktedonosporobacter rubrisoli]|uniref:TetR/AcrR family transcriptional regulator n=1 Tax=Ktedonosporobacter rubrisoli TaxID=2509675 RepID=A0A4P6JND5_KTERU|nr:TetR/AcrR family transcriptional regulator [Ktedonosporobacter rubrisoli]QBD76745.1 TetR/AcrR family transcriptional regulator [Ktedonosporobacter rubrisoli]